MTREQVSKMLLHMERLRMDSYEAESKQKEKRLLAEYRRLWTVVEPYVSGKQPYTPPKPIGGHHA